MVPVVLCLILFLFEVSPFLFLLAWPWSPALGWIGAAVSTVVVLLSITLARYFGLPLAASAAVPIGVSLGLYAAVRCIMKGGRDGSINWRGTRYKVKELQAENVSNFMQIVSAQAANETAPGSCPGLHDSTCTYWLYQPASARGWAWS